jgi:hypothetical protein
MRRKYHEFNPDDTTVRDDDDTTDEPEVAPSRYVVVHEEYVGIKLVGVTGVTGPFADEDEARLYADMLNRVRGAEPTHLHTVRELSPVEVSE